jgi:hypothetical protein
VDSSLNALRTYTDSSLNLKSSITYVDASLNLKSSIEYVDSSLNNLKTYTDVSLNLKVPIESPTFTGTAIIPTANITTLNNSGNANIQGNLLIGNNGYIKIKNLPIGFNNVQNSISIGKDALINNITGANNIAIGSNSMTNNTTGYYNIAIGRYSSNGMIAGSQNVSIGDNALGLNEDGVNNVAFGSNALFNNIHGNKNVAIGLFSGGDDVSGNNNTFLGAFSNTEQSYYNHSTAIGADSMIKGSNQIVLGASYDNVIIPKFTDNAGIVTSDASGRLISVSTITKNMVDGLTNVNNTSDIIKPVSTAQQAAVDGVIGTALAFAIALG